jgi:hypothetical protein
MLGVRATENGKNRTLHKKREECGTLNFKVLGFAICPKASPPVAPSANLKLYLINYIEGEP